MLLFLSSACKFEATCCRQKLLHLLVSSSSSSSSSEKEAKREEVRQALSRIAVHPWRVRRDANRRAQAEANAAPPTPPPPPPPPPCPPSAEPFPAAFPPSPPMPSPPAASSENPAPTRPASPEVLQTTAKSSPPPGPSFEEQYNAAWASYQQQMLLASMARWLGEAEDAGTDPAKGSGDGVVAGDGDGGGATKKGTSSGRGPPAGSGSAGGSRKPVTPPKSPPANKAKASPFMHRGHWMRGYRHCRVLIRANKGFRVLNFPSCPSFTSQATAAARRAMSGRASARTHGANSTGVRARDRWGGRLENDSRLHLW